MTEEEYLPETKICNKCKQRKLQTDFNFCSNSSDGLQSWCLDCGKKWWKIYSGKHDRRDYHLQYRYGITKKQYELILKSQNGVCAICCQSETVKQNNKIDSLAVDHDHKTNYVRGLLCRRCNTILGYIDNIPEFLEKVTQYLRKTSRGESKSTP